MKERVNKIKNWYGEHKEGIMNTLLVGGVSALCTVGGYLVGTKLTEFKNSIAIMRLHDKGLVQFVNPQTGVKISIAEANEVVKTIEW